MLKKIGLAVVLAALSGVAPAHAACKVEYFLWFPIEICQSGGDDGHGDGGHGNGGWGGAHAAPEMDPGSAMSGLSLALGGLAVLRARRSSKASRES